MAYSDNYPNGYKSGYSSVDDTERKDYSPMGEERARREAMARSEESERKMSDYNAGVEREKQHRQRLQEKREREEWENQQLRMKSQEQVKMYTETVKFLCEQKRNEYKKKNWFSKAMATLSGKGYYNTPFWDLATAEANKMSDEQLEHFYKNNVR